MSGHQYAGMAGAHIWGTKHVIFANCDSELDDAKWVIGEDTFTWKQLKAGIAFNGMDEWDFNQKPSEKRVSLLKYQKAWQICGRLLCKKHGLTFRPGFERYPTWEDLPSDDI